jgi:uncharacterized protein (TIGR03435 family)
MNMPANRFEATGVSVRDVIALAYGEPGPPPHTRASDQIVGGPNWLTTDTFTIIATAGSDTPAGPAGVPAKLLMLRRLLEERFLLRVHHDSREAAVLALVVRDRDGRLGPGLRRSVVDCRALLLARAGAPAAPLAPGDRPRCRAVVSPTGTLTAGALTMPDFANTLSRMTNRIVIDRTGLSGTFDVDLQFNPLEWDGVAPDPDRARAYDDQPSLFAALQEQLGLKLDAGKAAVDVVVIDSVERPSPD